MELIFRTNSIKGDPTEVSVDDSYSVTAPNEEVRADVQAIVDNITREQLHGGAPNLFVMIWSAVQAVYPFAKLVQMDKPPPEPEVKTPRVY